MHCGLLGCACDILCAIAGDKVENAASALVSLQKALHKQRENASDGPASASCTGLPKMRFMSLSDDLWDGVM